MSFSSEGTSGNSISCKDFISEDELEARRKKRQEEWEKVRNPDDPVEVPEEEYEHRSLFERLQEQKDKKQAEFEESHRLKNLIKGLDDDEVAFLELVDKTKMDMETKIWNDEMKEIEDFRKAVANLSEEESKARLRELRKTMKLPTQNSFKKSQDLLSAAVKRKASNGTTNSEKKLCISSSQPLTSAKSGQDSPHGDSPVKKVPKSCETLQCLGILPGLGAYSDSSDSDNSSNSENEKECDFDLIGRKRVCVKATKVQS